MRKIGEGWQYATYDLGDGRVLKKFHSPLKRFLIIVRDTFPFHRIPAFVIPRFVRGMREKAETSLVFIRSCKIEPAVFGHPVFTGGLDYSQDKVVPLEALLASASEARGMEIVEKFVVLTKNLLMQGVIDKSFNIGKNFGLAADGQVVLTDIGELFIGDGAIRPQLAKRPWASPYVLEAVPPGLHTHFVERMDASFL